MQAPKSGQSCFLQESGASTYLVAAAVQIGAKFFLSKIYKIHDSACTHSMNFQRVRTRTLACFTIRLSFSLKATAFFSIWASSHSKARFLLKGKNYSYHTPETQHHTKQVKEVKQVVWCVHIKPQAVGMHDPLHDPLQGPVMPPKATRPLPGIVNHWRFFWQRHKTIPPTTPQAVPGGDRLSQG